jgi:glycosyltransferase 2 family protein
MHTIRIVAGLTVGILFTTLLVRNIDIRGAAQAATLLGPYVLVLSGVLVIAGYSVRAWRWQLMLRAIGIGATYRQAAPIFFGAFALNNVLPLRAGDIYRCLSTMRLTEGTMPKSLATLLTERWLDLGALTIMLSILLLLDPNPSIKFVSVPAALFAIVGLTLLGVLAFFPVGARRLLDRVLVYDASRVRIGKTATWIRALISAIEGTLSKHSRLPIFGLTVLAWSFELGVFVLVGSVLSGGHLLSGGLYAGTLGTLATLIPGAPGHFGTFDFFAAQGFQFYGLEPEKAVAAAVVCHLAILAPVTVIGSLQLIADRPSSLNKAQTWK